jgi:hypothetical protein
VCLFKFKSTINLDFEQISLLIINRAFDDLRIAFFKA